MRVGRWACPAWAWATSVLQTLLNSPHPSQNKHTPLCSHETPQGGCRGGALGSCPGEALPPTDSQVLPTGSPQLCSKGLRPPSSQAGSAPEGSGSGPRLTSRAEFAAAGKAGNLILPRVTPGLPGCHGHLQSESGDWHYQKMPLLLMEADTETPEQGVAVTPQPGALPPSWKWASSGEHLRAVPLAIQSSIIWGEYVL